MQDKTKDVEIGGQRYRIGRFPARTGSWIAVQIMTKVLPSWLKEVDDGIPEAQKANRPGMTEEEFRNIQDHCLRACFRQSMNGDGGLPTPVLMADGRLDKDLEDDVVAVMALTVHCLMFNLAPFFQQAELKAAFESFQSRP